MHSLRIPTGISETTGELDKEISLTQSFSSLRVNAEKLKLFGLSCSSLTRLLKWLLIKSLHSLLEAYESEAIDVKNVLKKSGISVTSDVCFELSEIEKG
jgi:hypothetical protein